MTPSSPTASASTATSRCRSGFLPLASPLHLLMAAPQLLASVIGGSPYARQILYQYTSVMIAPIFIAAIEGARNVGCAVPVAAQVDPAVAAGVRLRHERRLVAVTVRRSLRRVGAQQPAGGDDAGGGRTGARRRRGDGDVQPRSAPVPARGAVRLAEPVLAGLLGQRGSRACRTAPATRARRSSTTSSSIARCSPATPIRRRSSTASSPATVSSRR